MCIKSCTITGLDRPGSEKTSLPEFLDNLHMKVIRLSALGTGHLYTRDISPLVIPVRTIVRL